MCQKSLRKMQIITMEGIGNFKKVRIAKLAIPKGFIGMEMILHLKNDMDHQVKLKQKGSFELISSFFFRNVFVSEFSHLWSGFAHLSQLVVIIWVCCKCNQLLFKARFIVCSKNHVLWRQRKKKNGGFYLKFCLDKKRGNKNDFKNTLCQVTQDSGQSCLNWLRAQKK